MAIRLPRFLRGVPLVEQETRGPTSSFHEWWERGMSQIEDQFADINVSFEGVSVALAGLEDKQDSLPSGTDGHVLTLVSGDPQWQAPSGGGGGSTAWGSITGTLSDQTDLQTALNGKQAAGSYAAASHSHIIADVTGLQTALDGKEPSLPSGTDGHVLTLVTGNPTWQAASGGGGTTVTFFQVEDDGTTGQLTTGSAAVLSGMWTTPSLTDSDFSWNGTTGVLTVNTAGTVEFDIKVTTHNNANNRHELHVQLVKNGSTVLVEDAQYASRNNTQDEGSVYLPGFKNTAAVNDTYELRVFNIGVAATVGASNVAGMTYLSAKLYT